jgi:hypothetical protein
MTIVAVASAVRRRSPAAESAAPTSEWQRLSTTSGFEERSTYSLRRAAAICVRAVAASAVTPALMALASSVAGCSADVDRQQLDQSQKTGSIGQPPPDTSRTTIGQWIWSSADSAIFVQAARAVPDLVPTVWVGTIDASANGDVASRLALSPRVAGRRSVAIVVRFEDSFTRAWAHGADSVIAHVVAQSLGSILRAAATSGVRVVEVQLDYDCPERLLARWGAVVAAQSRGVLAGTPVWITSLVAHVRQPAYGDLFRESVTGHILQVFDTGDTMSPSFARIVERLASRQRMPFRLGVGAFERTLPNGRPTDHRAWFAATRVMARSEWYRGLWVFPGSQPWLPLFGAR